MELNPIKTNPGDWGSVAGSLNENFTKILVAVTYLNNIASGGGRIYATLDELKAAYPNPKSGNWGYVSATLSFPATIYQYNGTGWINGGTGNGGDSVAAVQAALQTSLTSLSDKLTECLNEIVSQAQQYLPIQEDGWYFTDTEGHAMVSINSEGLDAAKLGANLITLIKAIPGIGLAIGTTTGTAFDGGVGAAMQAVVSKLNAIVNEIRPLVQSITEEGFNVTDSNGNVGMKYDAEGLDVAQLSAHIQELIRDIPGIGSGAGGTTYENLFQVSEEGFYVVDSDGNIGFGLNAAGETLGGGGGLEYEVISEIDYDI